MKKVLLVAAFAVSLLGYSQSNSEGTIHINLLGGFAFGGNVTDKYTEDNKSKEDKYDFASGTYGLNVHYGLNDKLSVGLGLSTGAYVLTRENLLTFDDPDSFGTLGASTTMSLFNINAQSRYYILNDDNLNIYGGVNLGFASANDKFAGFDLSTESYKASGLSYGLNVGLNYYYWEKVGGNIQLGYEGASLSGDYKYEGGSYTQKRSVGGINFMAGLAIKIN
jgi:long-subunit fatty acid transport protein